MNRLGDGRADRFVEGGGNVKHQRRAHLPREGLQRRTRANPSQGSGEVHLFRRVLGHVEPVDERTFDVLIAKRGQGDPERLVLDPGGIGLARLEGGKRLDGLGFGDDEEQPRHGRPAG